MLSFGEQSLLLLPNWEVGGSEVKAGRWALSQLPLLGAEQSI